jgi:hypothetical protein
MKSFLVTLAFTILIFSGVGAQSNDAYYLTLKEMFVASGVEETYRTAIIQMVDMYKTQMPGAPVGYWDELQQEFLRTSVDDLVAMLVPVYQKHMTIEDLRGLVEFYETPLGKKFITSTPAIMEESMQVGQAWGMKLGQELSKRLEERGY